MPTSIEAERFDGQHHPDVQFNGGTQQHYYGRYPVNAGDWLAKTPHGCKYPVKSDSFEGLFVSIATAEGGMRLLAATIRAILDAGLVVTGIDPTRVQVLTPEDHLASIQPTQIAELAPTGPKPNAPPGYSGDLSPCCGSMQEMKGTCKYCIGCGGSNGCS